MSEWRNPFPRGTWAFESDPNDGACSGHERITKAYWSFAGSGGPPARVRSGAREACRRLRAQRDRALALISEQQATIAATQAANELLLRERDEARRELRAAEWLHIPPSKCWWDGLGNPCQFLNGEWVRWSTCVEAALALGWTDCPDADPGARYGDASGTTTADSTEE